MSTRRLVRNISIVVLMVVIGIATVIVLPKKTTAPQPKERSQKNTASSSNDSTANPTKTFDKTTYSIDQPSSIWWIVNKKRPLPSGYVPANLIVPNVSLRLAASSEQMRISSKVAGDLEALFADAASSGSPLVFASGYRSEAYQRQLYNGYVQSSGQAAADRYSAKPGTSEHQTGLAFDICAANTSCDLVQAFGQTPTGIWVRDHAHEYGFIIRYLPNKEGVTGYEYEPWHLRYVGKDLATELQAKNLTMEEFFGL